ncbi:MAG TPA: AAA family ATPase, partial [Burkholderiaceae bacterium]|nr:AAA family ATPase [Burkholderiaceae bacterium]
MRLLRLHLQAFGPFTGRVIDLAQGGARIALIYGPNEAGKSATQRAIADLRFGVPQLSSDNFRHAHPDMRIAGVFADRQGREIGLVRRKGRSQTLLLRSPDRLDQESEDDQTATADIEAALTGGLSRAEYETMFSLDHQRLREGGAALLQGQGETGAALFEASSGVRSVRAILERLDTSARQFYVPGSRARSGRINEALRAHDEAQIAFKDALVRPARWTELAREHEAALLALEAVEMQSREHQQRQRQIGELRAVAPLLRSLDQAQGVLLALADAPVLPPEAPVRREAAQTGLAAARREAERVRTDREADQSRLERLSDDAAVLAQSPAIERLHAQAGALDEQLTELADTSAQIDHWHLRQQALAAGIDAALPLGDLKTPSASARALIEERLRAVETADQALSSHRSALARLDEEEDGSGQAVAEEAAAVGAKPDDAPSQGAARAALRSARTELTRHESLLTQLATWPAEMAAAERTLAQALAMLGMREADQLQSVTPLLDADIDTMLSQRDRIASQRESLARRIDEIDGALAAERQRHQEMLGKGAVPTADELGRARSHR